jgi:hypothetical protein
MRKSLFAFLMLILSSSAFAQELTLPELSGYKKQTNYPVFTADNLWDFINGAADTYLAYGFEDLHVAEYKKGKNVIKLEIYRHKDNTLAFGIYSTERSPSFRYLNIGGQGYSADGSINFFKGNYYVKIRTYSKNEKTLQAAESLALQTANMLKGDAGLPAELAQFPAEGKKANEETYINESVLGHKFLNNAFKAQYQLGSDVFSVFVMDKASTHEAVTTVNEYLKQTSLEPTDEDNGKFALNDGYNGTIFLAFKNSKIVLISGLAKDQSDVAERYTSEILK